MVAVLALAVLPLLFAQFVPPPRLELVQSLQAHSPLAPCPAPDAQPGGPSLVRPAPLKSCTWVESCQPHSFLAPLSALGAPVRWGYPPPPLSAPRAVLGSGRPSLVRPAPLTRCEWVQSCEAHSFLAPLSALGAPVRWGYPPPPVCPPCSSRQWQAQSCQACPRDALQVGPVLSGPLLPCPVFCDGTGTVGIPPPSCLPSRAVFGSGRPSLVRPAPLWRCEWVQSLQAHSFIARCGCQPLNCSRVQSCQARQSLPRAQCRRAGTRGWHGLTAPCPGLAPEPATVTGPLYGGLTFRFRGVPAGPRACWLPATAPLTRAVRGWQGTPPSSSLHICCGQGAVRARAAPCADGRGWRGAATCTPIRGRCGWLFRTSLRCRRTATQSSHGRLMWCCLGKPH